MKLKMIYAQNSQGAIGYKGITKLPWYYKEDLQHFKTLTLGQGILMGKNTFLSMGVLPKRTHYVLTSDKTMGKKYPEVHFADSFYKLLLMAKVNNHDSLFVIGGASVINENMERVDEIYRTLIPGHQLEGELALVDRPSSNFNAKILSDDGHGLVFQHFTKKNRRS